MEFFRRYQRLFFLIITFITIASFAFFGTFSAMSNESEEKKAQAIGHTVDGSTLYDTEVKNLSRFLSSSRGDVNFAREMPNLCNDGVVEKDFLETGIADLLAAAYFEGLQEDIGQRLEKIQRYRPYAHPEEKGVSLKGVWERFSPSLIKALELVQTDRAPTPDAFAHLSKLYLEQKACPPEFARRLLMMQQQALRSSFDGKLQYEDLALFGWHSLQDWFGPHFLDLVSQFILNGARVAEQKGYRVSLEEAKSELMRQFALSVQELNKRQQPVELTCAHLLRRIGLEEKEAILAWQTVLLFRRYFHEVGAATFVDRLLDKNVAEFAAKSAHIFLYQLPPHLQLQTFDDFIEFQTYVKAVSKPTDPLATPTTFFAVEEVEKRAPGLVACEMEGHVAHVSKEELGLLIPLKTLEEWQRQNEGLLKLEFGSMESASLGKVDRWSREKWIDAHPEWVQERLKELQGEEKSFSLSKGWTSLEGASGKLYDFVQEGKGTFYSEGSHFYRIEDLKEKQPRHILSFAEAKKRGVLKRLSEKWLKEEAAKRGEPYKKEEIAKRLFADVIDAMGQNHPLSYYPLHRFETKMNKARLALKANGDPSAWIQGEGNVLLEQLKLERKEVDIQQTTKEDGLKQQVFMMTPQEWSDLHFDENGEIYFFYFKEWQQREPVLKQLQVGQQIIAADAKRYVAEQLLEVVQETEAIKIPLDMEKE